MYQAHKDNPIRGARYATQRLCRPVTLVFNNKKFDGDEKAHKHLSMQRRRCYFIGKLDISVLSCGLIWWYCYMLFDLSFGEINCKLSPVTWVKGIYLSKGNFGLLSWEWISCFNKFMIRKPVVNYFNVMKMTILSYHGYWKAQHNLVGIAQNIVSIIRNYEILLLNLVENVINISSNKTKFI